MMRLAKRVWWWARRRLRFVRKSRGKYGGTDLRSFDGMLRELYPESIIQSLAEARNHPVYTPITVTEEMVRASSRDAGAFVTVPGEGPGQVCDRIAALYSHSVTDIEEWVVAELERRFDMDEGTALAELYLRPIMAELGYATESRVRAAQKLLGRSI